MAAFAMMTGVLVVAFPASVFSDLWSREVRRISKEYEFHDGDNNSDGSVCDKDAGENDTNNDDSKNQYPPGNNKNDGRDSVYHSTKAQDMAAVLSKMSLNLGSANTNSSIAMGPANNNAPEQDEMITMQREDLTDILNHLDTMRNSERRVRHILQKYKVQST